MLAASQVLITGCTVHCTSESRGKKALETENFHAYLKSFGTFPYSTLNARRAPKKDQHQQRPYVHTDTHTFMQLWQFFVCAMTHQGKQWKKTTQLVRTLYGPELFNVLISLFFSRQKR